MGSLRDCARSLLLMACLSSAALGVGSVCNRVSHNNVVRLMQNKKVEAYRAGRSVGYYDRMLGELEGMDNSNRWAVGYFVVAGFAGLGRYSLKRDEE